MMCLCVCAKWALMCVCASPQHTGKFGLAVVWGLMEMAFIFPRGLPSRQLWLKRYSVWQKLCQGFPGWDLFLPKEKEKRITQSPLFSGRVQRQLERAGFKVTRSTVLMRTERAHSYTWPPSSPHLAEARPSRRRKTKNSGERRNAHWASSDQKAISGHKEEVGLLVSVS